MKRIFGAGKWIRVRLLGADTANFLTYITGCGVCLSDIKWLNELTVTACLPASQLPVVTDAAQRKGVEIRVIQMKGAALLLGRLRKRPILLFGLALLLFLSWYIPGRILFIRIDGDHTVPAAEILEAAEECGVYFGASRRSIRSEQVKNHLLNQLPQLEWAGVNTEGCVAVISVSERTKAAQKEDTQVSSIIAQRDGVIIKCTVTAGTALCAPGQAVKKGDVLVSAYTDTGLCIRAQQAEGEIFAATNRELTVISPVLFAQRGAVSHAEQNISLIFGKKRINLFEDSGILPPSCDKMYSEYYVVLPGGFQLPIGIAVEKHVFYDDENMYASFADADTVAVQFAKTYLQSLMISGTLLHTQYTEIENDDVYILHTKAACSEMIGRLRTEESFLEYGKNN